MSYRFKRDNQSNQLKVSANFVAGLFSWPTSILKRIAEYLGCTRKKSAIVPPQEPEVQTGPEAFPARWIVLSDSGNDVKSVKNTLRFSGILNEQGELTDELKEVTIFHTGDLLDKKNPDPSVMDYWQLLHQDALGKGCDVKLIVGNHEQEIWQKIEAGHKYPIGGKKAQRMSDFIKGLDLFHVAGPILFIHGYPTVEFLQALLHFREVTGKDLNCFNTDHYKKALRSVKAMRKYAYVRENRRTNYLLYDVLDASRYYKKQGRVISNILARLKIDIVLHGHRPQRSGMQVDYEFGKWIPNIRMIGNDTMVRRTGIGATIIRATSSSDLDIVFINAKTASSKLRRKLQDEFRESSGSFYANCTAQPEIAELKSVAQV